jgi:hypothetical protein
VCFPEPNCESIFKAKYLYEVEAIPVVLPV